MIAVLDFAVRAALWPFVRLARLLLWCVCAMALAGALGAWMMDDGFGAVLCLLFAGLVAEVRWRLAAI